tara:strand:- start:3935 stop:4642 length:708 start_codon:yes stop_codon:yes gene_type:complete
MKQLFKKLIGEANIGRLNFFRRKDLRDSWGGTFNGQRFRQRIFFDLLYAFPIKAIVETGTFLGTTTALFGATGLPVYTCEIQTRYFANTRMRFRFNRQNIHQYRNNSPDFLCQLAVDSAIPKTDTLFYLDAHWEENLPLREEVEIIFSHWENAVVIVDDFCVPDSEYTFDDYGPKKRLDLDYLRPIMEKHQLTAFFPSANASEETGAKRGSVVLCKGKDAQSITDSLQILRQFEA